MSHWYCKTCKGKKEPCQVTFEELCEDCGTDIQWIETDGKIDTSELSETEKVFLIDQLLAELKIDNFGSTMDRPARCNYKVLYRDGEEVGKVLIQPYDK